MLYRCSKSYRNNKTDLSLWTEITNKKFNLYRKSRFRTRYSLKKS